jgi:hypothetical protein
LAARSVTVITVARRAGLGGAVGPDPSPTGVESEDPSAPRARDRRGPLYVHGMHKSKSQATVGIRARQAAERLVCGIMRSWQAAGLLGFVSGTAGAGYGGYIG